jgi:hypothetical protein
MNKHRLRRLGAIALLCLAAALPAMAQQTTITTTTCSGMDQSPWAPVVGSSISSVAATGYTAISESDGVRFYAFGPAWAGVLFKRSCALPQLPAKGSVTLSYEILTDDAGAIRSQAQESDIMLTGPKGEVYNCSNQNNNASGGHWQIVQNVSGKYQWTDTGFNPGRFAPDTWVAVSYVCGFDTTAQTTSMKSVTVGGASSPVPDALQNVPAQKLNWGNLNTAVVQFQQDINGQGGAWSEKVRNVTVTATW